MKDPWEDVREFVDFSENVVGEGESVVWQSPEQGEWMRQTIVRILSDADALLAVAVAVGIWEESVAENYMENERAVSSAFAALPEHLKEKA